jgi:hypothetical protein
MIEREFKLAAEPGVLLPDLTGSVAGVVVGPKETLQLEAVYTTPRRWPWRAGESPFDREVGSLSDLDPEAAGLVVGLRAVAP